MPFTDFFEAQNRERSSLQTRSNEKVEEKKAASKLNFTLKTGGSLFLISGSRGKSH